MLLSVLTSFTASVAYSSSACVDLVHHTFLVLQKNMDYHKETLFAVVLDVINCFPHIFKFYPIKGNNIPNRSTSRRLTVEDILATDSIAQRDTSCSHENSGVSTTDSHKDGVENSSTGIN